MLPRIPWQLKGGIVFSIIAKAGVLAVVLVLAAVYKVRDVRSAVMLAMAALASGLWLFGRRRQSTDAVRPGNPRLRTAEDYLWALFAILALVLLATN